MLVSRTGIESYKGVGNGVQVFGNLGGWWKPPCKKDGDRLFTIWFMFSLSLLSPCCSSIQNLCDYQTCDPAVRHSERLSLVFFFFPSILEYGRNGLMIYSYEVLSSGSVRVKQEESPVCRLRDVKSNAVPNAGPLYSSCSRADGTMGSNKTAELNRG